MLNHKNPQNKIIWTIIVSLHPMSRRARGKWQKAVKLGMGTKNILNKFKKHSVSFDVTEDSTDVKQLGMYVQGVPEKTPVK